MSLPQYPEYKDSGHPHISKVPSQWEIKPLKHCLRLITEKATGKSSPIALENIEGWSARYLPSESDFEGVGIAFRQGDILFGKLRPYLAKVYQAEFAGEAIGDFHVMRPVSGFIGRYALYQFLQESFISVVDGATHGAKMPRVGWEFMGNMPFVVPRPEEQLQIARFLSHETAKIDALIREQERLIELLQEKRQAVISHAVTKGLDPDVPMKDSGVEWLGEVPAHWEVAALKHLVIEPLKYGANEAAGDSNLDNPRFVRITDVTTEGTLREDTYRSLPPDVAAPYMLSEGDILLARSGATVGKAFIYRRAWGQCCFAGYLIKASADQEKVSPDFVYFVLQSSSYWQYIGQEQIQATIQNVSAERYGNFVLTFPTLHEQKSIIEYLQSKLDEYAGLLDVSKKTVKLLIERRSALISAAVTGKIDVRNWQPPVDESAFDEEVGQAGLETTV